MLQAVFNLPTGMPAPVVTALNEGMWSAAADNVLMVQQCQSCRSHRYPPADGCSVCSSLDWSWSRLAGAGVVYSYIWIPDRARSAAAGEPVLYNVAVITVAGTEGQPVRILSNIVDAWTRDDLAVGQRVELVGVPFAPGLAMPMFRKAD